MTEKELREAVVLENKGQKIFGVFHRPLLKEPTAAVLVCHGLAGHKSGKFRTYVDLASGLASKGIAVLRFDYRGCGDSEGLFSQVTPEDHISDALVALDYLSRHPSVDPERIGIMGRSFGGVIAVKAARRHGSLNSMALWCPMFSGEQWLDQWQLVQSGAVNSEGSLKMMQVNGQQGALPFFDQFFRIQVEDDLRELDGIPLLHIHGEKDQRVSIEHAEEYARARAPANGNSKFIRLPNSDHDFDHMEERQQALKETCEWFAQTLRR